MATFTLFAYGTGENNESTNNIISQFGKACASEHIILEGTDILGLNAASLAEFGAKHILKWLKKQEAGSHHINMTGFSRGSVSCIRIANILKREQIKLEIKKSPSAEEKQLLAQLKTAHLNLYLTDPVAGFSDKAKPDARIVPANVKNYISVLQIDERRRDFKPQDITRIIIKSPQITKVSMLPMYGCHSDTIKIRSEGMTSGATINWYGLHQFLTQFGTVFKEQAIPQMTTEQRVRYALPLNPSAKTLLALFSKNHEERFNYYQSGLQATAVDGLPVPRVQRTLNQHLDYYVKNADFFVNQLERELFKISYPKSFNYCFESNLTDLRFPDSSNCTKEQVIEELRILKDENPLLFKLLSAYGVTFDKNEVLLGNPTGCHYLEPCISIQQMFPHLVPNAVKNAAMEMNKLPLLEQEIYRFTFQYQREKLSLYFFGERSLSDLARQIRKEVNNIVNLGTESREQKFTLILNRLEYYYKLLVLGKDSSDLTQMLKEVLSKNGRVFDIHPPSFANTLLVDLIHNLLSLIKEIFSFAANLGYLGGGILFTIGSTIEAFGVRIADLIRPVSPSNLKNLAFICAKTLEFLGITIKNSLGIKPVFEYLAWGIGYIRDNITRTMTGAVIEEGHIEALHHDEALDDSSMPFDGSSMPN